jgi:tRNA(fMet)-specific endonuclease VapC
METGSVGFVRSTCFLRHSSRWPLTIVAASHYADIRHYLELQGIVIGPNDLKIAAIARAHGLTLVTHDLGEFTRVQGLKVENWDS